MSQEQGRREIPVEDVPSNPELAERMVRVEEAVDHIDEKQDHVIEKIDEVADNLDEDLAQLQESHQEVRQRNAKMWLGVQVLKWGGGSAGLLAMAVSLAL